MGNRTPANYTIVSASTRLSQTCSSRFHVSCLKIRDSCVHEQTVERTHKTFAHMKTQPTHHLVSQLSREALNKRAMGSPLPQNSEGNKQLAVMES